MKKWIFCLIIILLLPFSAHAADRYYYDNSWQLYSVPAVTVTFDNVPIAFDVPPLIINDRTLVPVRGLFEASGANVLWDDATRSVKITTDIYTILLIIDSTTAVVNDTPYVLDVPAKIVIDAAGTARTLVPLRFISEALSYTVQWSEATYTVSVFDKALPTPEPQTPDTPTPDTKTPEPQTPEPHAPNTQIPANQISHTSFAGGTSLHLLPTITVVKESDTEFTVAGAVDETATFQDPYIQMAVISNGKLMLYTPGIAVTATVTADTSGTTITLVRPALTDKLDIATPAGSVVIDPGHGGSDPGAISTTNEVIDFREKDANLDISLMTRDILANSGIQVSMTRESDVYVGLKERAIQANNINASIFVSIHNNSFTSDSAYGTMVYYYANSGASVSGNKFTGERLARLIQQTLIETLGTYDRGIANGSRFVVIKETEMPAVIVECAFISNPDDKARLQTYDFRKKAAYAIAKAIAQSLTELTNG